MNRRSLYRCRHDRRIAGVAAGVAEFFDLDPTLVRLVWFLSIFFGGFGLLLYIVMAIIVPNEPLSEEELRAELGRCRLAAPPRRPIGERRPGADVRRTCPDRVRGTRAGEHVLRRMGLQRQLPVARLHPGDRGPARRGRVPSRGAGADRTRPASGFAGAAGSTGRTDERRAVIAAPILIVGLLLVLTSLFSARIPGEASFASSGIPLPRGATEQARGTRSARSCCPRSIRRPGTRSRSC